MLRDRYRGSVKTTATMRTICCARALSGQAAAAVPKQRDELRRKRARVLL